MKAERWEQVERLYHSALERGADERTAFLAEACAGDDSLRREVESLLAYEDQAEDFIESPALEVAAEMLAREQGATVAAGQIINQYRVTSPLGAGGMGEVYLASDTKLGRQVALKFLPAHFTQDEGHLRRFTHEARAVAALSHPNVCTIHEVAETVEGRHCIVMEYVEGATLRERLAEGRMTVGEALDAAIQVAAALAAAHAAGVVHRDIKPENVMLRRDALVKVLDFGLAKLTGQQTAAADGASLWAESFDMRFTDIFAIQDGVSKEVAARLRLRLGPAEQARLAQRHTANAEAYSYYTKAMYHFSKRGFSGGPQEETEAAIDLLKRAIELDPNYALAHAQLGYAYAWMADFKEAGPGLIASAKEELRAAERLDPQLPEVHVARSFIAWSHYEDWQIEAALREARLAKQLDPGLPNHVLAAIYYHVGLEEQAAKEYELELEQEPESETVKLSYILWMRNVARPDEWQALNRRLFNRGPDGRYYLEKRMLKEAAPLIEEEYAKNPDEPEPRRDRALLMALQGKHREAQAAVPRIMERVRRNKGYHHYTYDIARIYALDGKGEEASKWLRATVKEGFPCYTLFARDPFLDPIRKDPAFIQFMDEMKSRWEGYRREFG
ncbi:MAG: protein kinase domain-containing protein [Pyrinomonadaceae bacterium]